MELNEKIRELREATGMNRKMFAEYFRFAQLRIGRQGAGHHLSIFLACCFTNGDMSK